MNKKEHLTSDGLQQIINIRASLNNGLSDVLKSAFADFTAVPRPLVIDQKIPDPHWLAGCAPFNILCARFRGLEKIFSEN